MKLSSLIAVSALICLPLFAGQTVVLVKLLNASDYTGSWNITSGITAMIAEDLNKTGKYTVIEKLPAKFYSSTSTNDRDKAVILGRENGAQIVMSGLINEFSLRGGGIISPGLGGGIYYNASARITLKVTRVADGDQKTIEAKGGAMSLDVGLTLLGGPSQSENVESGSLLERLERARFGSEVFRKTLIGQAVVSCMTDCTAQIERLYPVVETALDAAVMLVEPSSVYLNIGFGSGIKEGYRFAVYRDGEAVKDSKTGAVLGKREIAVGEIEITEVKAERFSVARIVRQDVPMLKGDRIKFIRTRDENAQKK
ncbi:MAG: hypothetical protein HZC28_16355 [Spirochaetes bacterium]|nr:hypothetical protein [Spirochaetota bacterium]